MGIQPDDTGQKKRAWKHRAPEAQQSAAHYGEEINSHNGAGTHQPIQPVDYIGKDWSVVPVPLPVPKRQSLAGKSGLSTRKMSRSTSTVARKTLASSLGRKSKGLADLPTGFLIPGYLVGSSVLCGDRCCIRRASKPKSHWLWHFLEMLPTLQP